MARVYLKGLPELKAKLIRLKEQTAVDVRPAMEAGAAKVVAMAQSLVPDDSGALRESIGWAWGDAPEGSIKIASYGRGENRITIFAGNREAYYARFVEFGVAPHTTGGIFKGGQHPGTSPQPYFFPAWRAMRKELKREIAKAIRASVQKAAA